MKVTTRMYASHRRAWTPRTWPPLLLATPITLGAVQLFHASVVVAVALGVVVGLGFGWARWALWRWRHPIITPGQYIEDLRRNARWN